MRDGICYLPNSSMRKIKISCPGCGLELDAEQSLVGRFVECSSCSHRFRIPKLPMYSTDDPEGADGNPKRRKKSSGQRSRKTTKVSNSSPSRLKTGTKSARGRPRKSRGKSPPALPKTSDNFVLRFLCNIVAGVLVVIVFAACGIKPDVKILLLVAGFVGFVIFELVSKRRK